MASDNFNANSNPLASPWASVGSLNQLKALSGVAVPVTASSDSAMRYSTSTEAASSVTVGAGGDGDGGPAMLDSSANGYFVSCAGGSLSIYRMIAGSSAQQSGTAYTPAANDIIKLDVTSPTVVVVFLNGSSFLTHGDATFRTGLVPSIFIFGTITFTDWTDGISIVNATATPTGGAGAAAVGDFILFARPPPPYTLTTVTG